MQTKCSLTKSATRLSSNDSCAMTWHQWHAAYPTDSRIGTPRSRAAANASSPHCHQSTGLSLCWRRYGLVASARRLGTASTLSRPCNRDHMRRLALTSLTVALTAVTVVTSSAATGTDGPPVSHLDAHTVLPPGENGDFSTDEQAQYEADGDPSDFGAHVDDQREMYWTGKSKSAAFQQPTGTP